MPSGTKSLYTYTISPPVGWESWNRNPRKLCERNPEFSGALESEMQLNEFGIPLTTEIQNPTSTDKDWNPVPGIRNPRAWNPESKTLLHSLTWGKTDVHPPLFWVPFTVTDETMPTSPNDSSSSSPPLITNLCCPFRAALAPSSRHVHSIVIAYRWSSVTHCTSLGCFSECIRRQKSRLVFWNTPLLPSHKHQYLWIVTFQNSLIGIESSITSPPLFTQVASAPPFPINWWTKDGECLSESSGLTLQGLFRHMHASFVLLVLWTFMEPAGLADLYSCDHLWISRPLS